MPIFAASTRTSLNSVSICMRTKSGGTGKIPWTPTVFCAVSAATTAQAYAPFAEIAFTSARIPAPPEGSTPAMERTFGMARSAFMRWAGRRGCDGSATMLP